MPEQRSVFISYRRPVSSLIASAVYQHLLLRRYDSFMDYEPEDTDEFDAVLLRQIDSRAHFIVLLTPGDMRLYAHELDWQRRKILHAMSSGRHIVTLLLNGFDFREAEPYFTEGLAALASYPAITVPADYFEAAMDRLREVLDNADQVTTTPMPRGDATVISRSTHRLAQLKKIAPEQLQAEDRFQRAFTRPDHDHEARIVDFSEALTINPKYVAAYLHRSASRRIAGDLEGAVADASDVIRLQAAEPGAYTARGIAYYLRGDVDEAIADYSEALRLQPYDAATLINRGDARRASGYFEGALADYSGAIDRSPATREAYYEFCRRFSIAPARNIPDTLAQFSKLQFIAYNNRGEIRRIQKDMPGAIEDFTAALALAPDNGNALLNRAEARMQMDDMSGAILDLTYALESDPQNPTLFHQRGFAWHEKGNNEAALADYASALALNPRAALTYCNRAEIFLEHEDYESALADWNTAHELRPGYRLILAGLALTHYGTGNTELATEVWRLLTGADDRFKDADEVGQLLNWKAPLIEKTRQMLSDIG